MSGLGRLNIELSLDAVKFQQNLKKSEKQARLFANRTVEYLKNIETAANNINSATRWNLRFEQFDKGRTAAKQLINYADRNTKLGMTMTELKAMSDERFEF